MDMSMSCSLSRKRRGVALIVVGAMTIGVAAVPARADLHFTEPLATAGVVYAGAPLSHEFTFENEGPETVAILEARASCGCLKPRLGQNTYRSGDKGSVVLEVNTLSQAPGPHTWAVTLSYRAGNQAREMPLRLSARLVSEVTVQPAALIAFADKLDQHELVLTDFRAKSLEVLEVRASSAKLLARVGKVARDASGHFSHKIGLAVADDYPDGRHEEILDIYTNDPRYPDLRVPVTVIKHVQQRLAATPSQIDLVAPAGQPFPARIVLLRDNHDQTIHIDRILSDDPAIVCHWAQGPGAMATLRVRLDRTLAAGENLHSAVHVRIDQPVRETVTIPVACTVR
jgi:hypothetical protein